MMQIAGSTETVQKLRVSETKNFIRYEGTKELPDRVVLSQLAQTTSAWCIPSCLIPAGASRPTKFELPQSLTSYFVIHI
jgi:hypothetical protein